MSPRRGPQPPPGPRRDRLRRARRDRPQGPERLGDLLPSTARRLGLEEQLDLSAAMRAWDLIVSEHVPEASGSCRLTAFDQGVATVAADQPIVAQELRLRVDRADGGPPVGRPDPSARASCRRCGTYNRRLLTPGRFNSAASRRHDRPSTDEPRHRRRGTEACRLPGLGPGSAAEHRGDQSYQGQPLPGRHRRGGRRSPLGHEHGRGADQARVLLRRVGRHHRLPQEGPARRQQRTARRPSGWPPRPARAARSASPWPSSEAASCTWPRPARPRPTWSATPGC